MSKNETEQKNKLIQLKKEIKSLEYNIKHIDSVNARINIIKKLKLAVRTLQKMLPYIVTAGIISGGCSAAGMTPFYRDEYKSYSNVMMKFDNNGNFSSKQQYGSFKNEDGTVLSERDGRLYYYSKWSKSEDGLYSRIVLAYSIKNKTCEEIMNLLEKDNLDLEDILGKPISSTTETKNNLNDDELEKEPYIDVIIYSEDKNDYTVYRESVSENILYTIFCILLTLICEIVPLEIRSTYAFDYDERVEKIKNRYRALDPEELEKKLELKRNDYNSMIK